MTSRYDVKFFESLASRMKLTGGLGLPMASLSTRSERIMVWELRFGTESADSLQF